MSRIVIFGGTGYAGSNIARAARARGHEVVSYSRSAPAERLDGVEYRIGSVADAPTVFAAAAEADDLVVAVHGADVDGAPLLDRLSPLVAASVTLDARLSFVGGAGSSLVAEGGPRLVDTPDFQDEWKPEALSHAAVLAELESAPGDLRWFYVSPPAMFGAWMPGEATGGYRTGGDVLVTDAEGQSSMSGADFGQAFVDEIERVAHPNQRFTVGH